MRKLGVGLLLLCCLASLVGAVRINEIELDPESSDSGKEWVELYSKDEINLTGWQLVNEDNETINLTQTFQGFLIINSTVQWLDNDESILFLKDSNGTVEDETEVLSDNENDNQTWQYCEGTWEFAESTKNSSNACTQEDPDPGEGDPPDPDIFLTLDWDSEDVINGAEFEIDIKGHNLDDEEYDVKIYITFKSNDTVISDTYDDEDDAWRSSQRYVEKVLVGPENDSASLTLEIDEDFRKFDGTAKIRAKIRETGKTAEKAYTERSIKILEEEEESLLDEGDTLTPVTTNSDSTTDSTNDLPTGKKKVIKLGKRKESEELDEESSEVVVYESRNEKVQRYIPYGLSLILVGVIVVLIKKKV